MVWRQVTIDESITRFGSGLVHVAEGDYRGKVLKVSASPEDRDYEDNDPFFAFDFQLADGPDGLGKTLRYIGMLSPAKADGSGGAWGLGKVLDALGADPKSLVGMNFETYAKFAKVAEGLSKKLSGQMVGLEVGDDQYTGRGGNTSIISRIFNFFPDSEWELRSKPRTASAAPSPAARNGKPSSSPQAADPSPGSAPAPDASASSNGTSDEVNLDDEISRMFAGAAAS